MSDFFTQNLFASLNQLPHRYHILVFSQSDIQRKTLVIFGPEIWEAQKFGGISKYFSQLITRVSADPRFEVRVLTFTLDNVELQELALTQEIKIIKKSRFVFGMYSEMRNFRGSKIYHQTYYKSLNILVARLFKFKTFLTVYDLISEIFPSRKSIFTLPRLNNKKWSIKSTDRLIAISNCTKIDLEKFYSVSNKPIEVIHLASGESQKAQNDNVIISNDYFLYVGKRSGYKNFKLLLEAMVLLRNRGYNPTLIAYGGGDVEVEFMEFVSAHNLKDQVIFTNDEITLDILYQGARGFIYPSLYEGFGIPLLDAMKFYCPVIASDIPSTREVGSDFVEYFDPLDAYSLSSAMEIILESSASLALRKLLAFEHATKYSWEATALRTCQYYLNSVKQ